MVGGASGSRLQPWSTSEPSPAFRPAQIGVEKSGQGLRLGQGQDGGDVAVDAPGLDEYTTVQYIGIRDPHKK